MVPMASAKWTSTGTTITGKDNPMSITARSGKSLRVGFRHGHKGAAIQGSETQWVWET